MNSDALEQFERKSLDAGKPDVHALLFTIWIWQPRECNTPANAFRQGLRAPEDSMSDISVGAEASKPLSQWERVLDTFITLKTFTDILRDTSWWLP